jgi:UDP-N-acetyl-L-fucosamine synthase
VGTRPEIIRLSSIIKKFDKHFSHRLIHTGQNPDPNLKDVFFSDLGLKNPDRYFGTDSQSLGKFLANMFVSVEDELVSNRPDAVVILGDTNSAFAAIIARRLGIPVYHLEAGNRSFDFNVPEEINRRIIDHAADFNLVYSELARNNLISEGLHPRQIALVGSPLKEVINDHKEAIKGSQILYELNLQKDNFFLVSIHRQENVDLQNRLTEILATLESVAAKYQVPVVISTHPRTLKKIETLSIKHSKYLLFHDPFGFLDYSCLQMNARMVLSDSGSVSEESVILGFPAITLRDSIERPEAIESGSIIMAGISSTNVLEAIEIAQEEGFGSEGPWEYAIPDTSTRVVNFILSTIHQYHFWNGIRESN